LLMSAHSRRLAMFFLPSRSKVRVRRQRSTGIRLEVLEDRLPPGDILFGLALGSVWLRSDNIFGSQVAVVNAESAEEDSNRSVERAGDAMLPLRNRHVSRLADAAPPVVARSSDRATVRRPWHNEEWLDQPAIEAHRRQVSANEESPALISRQTAGIGV